jgi:membrane-bound lytic murein transglycosylase D
MLRRSSFGTMLCAALLAACARSGAPVVAPVPAPIPAPAPAVPGPAPDGATPATATRTDSVVAPVVSDSEVVARARGIFGATTANVPVDSALPGGPSAAGSRDDTRASFDIDVANYETRRDVSRWVQVFSVSARRTMQEAISRGTRYDAMLRRKFREAGLPEDMTYLALIESFYKTHALSRARALGMWQFMAPTARSVGMRVDSWVDERRDPVRATEGAIDFLTDLHNAYGSWYLAAAAYNGGPGRVSRGLSRFSEELDGVEGDDRFFALAEQRYLPGETKAYVPKLIAATLVAKEPARYGLRVDTMPAFEYDSVMVAAGVPLSAVAAASRTTIDAIKDLNPHFLRGVTPPGEASEVRIPVGMAGGFAASFRGLPDSLRLGYRLLTLDEPRRASDLAGAAGVPVRALRAWNPRVATDRRGTYRSGVVLRVPTVATLAGARDVPADLGAERSTRAERVADARVMLVSQRVRVRRGETLSGIARRHGLSVAQLKAMNGLRSGNVQAGRVLVVRRPSRAAVAAARREARSRAPGRGEVNERCTTSRVRVRGRMRSVRRCVPVRDRTVRGADGARETCRVVKQRIRGRLQSVRRCTTSAAPQRAARAKSAVRSNRGSARSGGRRSQARAKTASPRRTNAARAKSSSRRRQ